MDDDLNRLPDKFQCRVSLEWVGGPRFAFYCAHGRVLARAHPSGALERYEGYAPERCAVLFWSCATWAWDPQFPPELVPLRFNNHRHGLDGIDLTTDGEAIYTGDYVPDAAARELWEMVARLRPDRVEPAAAPISAMPSPHGAAGDSAVLRDQDGR